MSFFHRTTCRLCESSDLAKVIELTATPPANAFVPQSELDQVQEVFPLDVWICNDCSHVQLLDVVDPSVLFGHYVYVSGTSPVFVSHFQAYAGELLDRFAGEGCSVLDIGSNDGTLLRFFQQAGCTILGVDPAQEISSTATEQGIETICGFFSCKMAEDIASSHGTMDIVTANNVCAHIDDLSDLVKGVKRLLSEHGVFVFEVSYLRDVYEKLLFDTIYHEHLDYHCLSPLISFFKRFGLRVFDAKRIDSHGGSLRVYVCHATASHAETSQVGQLCREEVELGLTRAETFRSYGQRVAELGAELRAIIEDASRSGKQVAAFGAPAKATTLMYHFGLTSDTIDFIIDDSPLKQGLYSPGLHIPVVPSAKLYEAMPDLTVILAWNFADAIIRNHQAYLDKGGVFVVPLPTLRTISAGSA